MKYSASIKLTMAVASIVAIGISTPTMSVAKEYNLCNLDTVPESIQKRITRRADYADILSRMFDNCPESALALTEAATASIDDGIDDEGDRVNSGDEPGGDNPGGDTPGGDNPGDDNPGGGTPPGGGGTLPG